MKRALSSFDISLLAEELNAALKNGYVEKIYHRKTPSKLVLRINVPNTGRKDLIVHNGCAMCITSKKEEFDAPTDFAMTLRKYLTGSRVESISQHEFDRIVKIKLKKERQYNLIVELFGNGNIILTDENETIILPLHARSWRHRELKQKCKYLPPPSVFNPYRITLQEFVEKLRNSKKDLVRTLAININLGGFYSERILELVKLDKNLMPSDMGLNEITKVYDCIQQLLKDAKTSKGGLIVYSGEEPVDVLPAGLKFYPDAKSVFYEQFNDAVDYYFSQLWIKDEMLARKKAIDDEIAKYRHILEEQRATLKKYDAELAAAEHAPELIYKHYNVCENVLKKINTHLTEKTDIERAELGEEVVEIDLKSKTVVLAFKDDAFKLTLDFTKNLHENAAVYYEKAKQIKRHIEGVKCAYSETVELLRSAVAREISPKLPEKDEKKVKKFWFENYRWFFASTGELVLAGKDARQNELVVKKYLKTGDRFAHADIQGGAAVVIKKGEKPISETALQEACAFAAIFSKAWSAGLGSVNAYWVTAEQVSKSPEEGSFLPKGAFMVRGKRNYVTVELKAGVCEINYENQMKLMCAPLSAVQKIAEKYFVIKPGSTKKTVSAKKIADFFNTSVETILSVTPPGNFDIVAEPK